MIWLGSMCYTLYLPFRPVHWALVAELQGELAFGPLH